MLQHVRLVLTGAIQRARMAQKRERNVRPMSEVQEPSTSVALRQSLVGSILMFLLGNVKIAVYREVCAVHGLLSIL